MRGKVFATLVLAATVASCVQTGPGGFLPSGPQYATGQQVFNSVTNFSVSGTYSDGTAFCEYHEPSGQVRGNDGQGAYQGTWAVAGNQICYTYPQRGVINSCQDVTIQNNRITYYSSGQAYGSGNLIGGNICG